MKRIFAFTALGAAIITASSFTTDDNISKKFQENFDHYFKNASAIIWNVSDDYTKADFIEEDRRKTAVFTNDGQLYGVSTEISFKELPKEARIILNIQYEDYYVDELLSFKTKDGEIKYYARMMGKSDKVILEIFDNGFVSEFKRSKI